MHVELRDENQAPVLLISKEQLPEAGQVLLQLLAKLGREKETLPPYTKDDASSGTLEEIYKLYSDDLKQELEVVTRAKSEQQDLQFVTGPRPKYWHPKRGKAVKAEHKIAVLLRVASRNPPPTASWTAEDGSEVFVENDNFGLRKAFNTTFGPAAHIEKIAREVENFADLWVLCDRGEGSAMRKEGA